MLDSAGMMRERATRKAKELLRSGGRSSRSARATGIYYFLNQSLKELALTIWDFGVGRARGIKESPPFRLIPGPVLSLVFWPASAAASFFWFLYISLPLSIVLFGWNFFLAVTFSLSRHNTHTRQMAIHLAALSSSLHRICVSVVNVKISELLLNLLQAVFEVFSSWTSAGAAQSKQDRSLSLRELNDLLAYEELDDASADLDHTAQRKMRSMMHHYVPANPFRAVTQAPGPQGADNKSDEADADADSPASFPPTPFSRARVMSHSTERVVSTMFAARDRLRIEAQSASRDEHSRKAAVEAQTSGQMAVFDARQTSDGLALTCGNHCALKVGRALCCSSRAMIPLRVNAYIYLEFSVTAQSGQMPSLALGLAPTDCPLNVMVGSWPGSIGLHSDGQLLIGSRWFQGRGGNIEAGSTIGILAYRPGGGGSVEQDAGLAEVGGDKATFTAGARVSNAAPTKATAASAAKLVSASAPTSSSSSTRSSGSGSTLASPLHALDPSAPTPAPESSVPTPFVLNFAINGRPAATHLGPEAAEAMSAVSSGDSPLFPTISLLSQDTRVWCRFCEADIVYRSRAALGAPPGVRVYCLDGSLLLDESA